MDFKTNNYPFCVLKNLHLQSTGNYWAFGWISWLREDWMWAASPLLTKRSSGFQGSGLFFFFFLPILLLKKIFFKFTFFSPPPPQKNGCVGDIMDSVSEQENSVQIPVVLLHSFSYRYFWKRYESLVYGLNSRTDWTLQPWLATSLGEGQLWIQNTALVEH